MEVPINLTGGDFQHKSRPLSNQITRNFWPQPVQNAKARSPYVLTSFYGLKTFKTQSGGADRGMKENQGTLYKVSGTTLYTVASDGTHTSRGTISGAARCVMSALGSSMIIVNGSGAAYVWDGATLTEITDADLLAPNGVAVLNNQAIFDDGAGQGFAVSDAGDPLTVNALNTADAESASDALKCPYAYRETLYLFGEKTIELWWNSGQGNPPFDKIQGAIINVGLASIHSLADNPDFIFFLGHDAHVHTLTGGSGAVDTQISTPALAKTFQGYTLTDAIGWTMELEGQWFYALTFPTDDITWVYPVGGEWFQWGTGEGRIRANSYAYAFNKHLVADYASADIYELDAETYTDAGATITRRRDSAPLHGGLFQADGKYLEMSRLEIFMETGVGLTSGQGSDPEMMISFSDDGGKTFGVERVVNVGTAGEFQKSVVLTNLGRFKSRVIRVQVSDPIYWAIYSAKADIEVCI